MPGIDKALMARINAEHRACEVAACSAVGHAIRCGEMLSEVKASLEHGAFAPWLRENFEGSERTAQTYMKLRRGRDALDAKTQRAADLSIRGALRELEPASGEEKLSENRFLWNGIALLIEDHPETFLSDGEIPLIIGRLWNGPRGEADAKLLREYREALDSVSEATTELEHLNNIALTGWRTRRAIESWVTNVVGESGDRVLLPQRLRREASLTELGANPETWEVYWSVAVEEPLRRTVDSARESASGFSGAVPDSG